MKSKTIILKFKGKKISLNVEDCNFLEKGRGLTFRRRETAPILLFDFTNKIKDSLTSFFVFFDFLAIWTDKENNVLEIKRIKPWRFHINSKTNWSKIIEIPINRKYRRKIALIVGGQKDLNT